MLQLMRPAVATLSQVFIYIDTLDECFPKNLLELIESLKDILQKSPRAQIFVRGRPHVEAEIVRYFGAGITIPISLSTNNIKRYWRSWRWIQCPTRCLMLYKRIS